MTTYNEIVENHYQGPDEQGLVAKIKERLDQLPAPITTALLAPLDHFHAKGLAGTVELAHLLEVQPESVVLDAGSGLGGPARYLAETYGCQVTGVDLTPAYVEIARLLSERTGLSSKTAFEVGDILSLPFPDDHFDLVWTQHVVMNIRNREALYLEFNRVLKSGGKLGFFDVIRTDEKLEPVYPLPWAETPETSFLLNQAETLALLGKCHFTRVDWKDVSDEALADFQKPRPSTPPPISLFDVIGPRAAKLIPNLPLNVMEGRIRFVMGTFTKS